MKKYIYLLAVLTLFTLFGCAQNNGDRGTDASSNLTHNVALPLDESAINTGFVEYVIKEAGMSFSYSNLKWETPEVIGDYVLPDSKNVENDGLATEHHTLLLPLKNHSDIEMRVSFTKPGYLPEYEAWYGDFIGDIAKRSKLEEICDDKIWDVNLLVDCRIVRDGQEHIELYIATMGLDRKEYLLDKVAIFLTDRDDRPGVFFSIPINNINQTPKTETETKILLEDIASDKTKSVLIQEFDDIIRTVKPVSNDFTVKE